MKHNRRGVISLSLLIVLGLVAVAQSSDEGPAILISNFDDIDAAELPIEEVLVYWLESVFSANDDITVEYLDRYFPITDQSINVAVSAGQEAGGDIVLFGSYQDKGDRIDVNLISVITTDCPSASDFMQILFEDEEGFSVTDLHPGSPVPPQLSFYANMIVSDWMSEQNRQSEALLFLESSLLYADAVSEDYLPELYSLIANTYRIMGMYQAAIDGFSEALNLDPTDFNSLCLRAVCYDAIDSLDLAIDDLMIAVVLDPDNATTNAQLGAQLTQAGRQEEGQQYLDRSIELDPFCAMTFRDRSRSFYLLGQYEPALTYINMALAQEPESAQGHAFKGILLQFTGEQAEAIEELTIAIELETDLEVMAWSYYARASCYMDLGDYQIALADLTASADCSPSSYTVLYLTGVCHMQLGSNELAELYLSEYLSYPLELTPVDPWTTPDLPEKAEAFLEDLRR
ncbi:MAG: tetratricopeptide repeat protein [Candidatus Aegiribacteria sp.]|nr:tetratricopeptide repeat protein [Candidatus Aegiribacteria sp.]